MSLSILLQLRSNLNCHIASILSTIKPSLFICLYQVRLPALVLSEVNMYLRFYTCMLRHREPIEIKSFLFINGVTIILIILLTVEELADETQVIHERMDSENVHSKEFYKIICRFDCKKPSVGVTRREVSSTEQSLFQHDLSRYHVFIILIKWVLHVLHITSS